MERKQIFSIKKLKVGAASVLIGTGIVFLGTQGEVLAAEESSSSTRVTSIDEKENARSESTVVGKEDSVDNKDGVTDNNRSESRSLAEGAAAAVNASLNEENESQNKPKSDEESAQEQKDYSGVKLDGSIKGEKTNVNAGDAIVANFGLNVSAPSALEEGSYILFELPTNEQAKNVNFSSALKVDKISDSVYKVWTGELKGGTYASVDIYYNFGKFETAKDAKSVIKATVYNSKGEALDATKTIVQTQNITTSPRVEVNKSIQNATLYTTDEKEEKLFNLQSRTLPLKITTYNKGGADIVEVEHSIALPTGAKIAESSKQAGWIEENGVAKLIKKITSKTIFDNANNSTSDTLNLDLFEAGNAKEYIKGKTFAFVDNATFTDKSGYKSTSQDKVDITVYARSPRKQISQDPNYPVPGVNPLLIWSGTNEETEKREINIAIPEIDKKTNDRRILSVWRMATTDTSLKKIELDFDSNIEQNRSLEYYYAVNNGGESAYFNWQSDKIKANTTLEVYNVVDDKEVLLGEIAFTNNWNGSQEGIAKPSIDLPKDVKKIVLRPKGEVTFDNIDLWQIGLYVNQDLAGLDAAREKVQKGEDAYSILTAKVYTIGNETVNESTSTTTIVDAQTGIKLAPIKQESKLTFPGENVALNLAANIEAYNYSSAGLGDRIYGKYTIGGVSTSKKLSDLSLNNAKLLIELPDGFSYEEIEVGEVEGKKVYKNDDSRVTVVKNYNNTGKNVLVVDGKDFQTSTVSNWGALLNLTPDLKLKTASWLQGGTYTLNYTLVWDDNNKVVGLDPNTLLEGAVGTTHTSTFSYDVLVGSNQATTLVTQIADKKDAPNDYTSTLYNVAPGTEVTYRFTLNNNSNSEMFNNEVLFTLPTKGDKAITNPDVLRNSTYDSKLTGAAVAPSGWKAYYSVTPISGDANAIAKTATLSADQISDWTKVTAVKFVSDKETALKPKLATVFYAPAKLSDEAKTGEEAFISAVVRTGGQEVYNETNAASITVREDIQYGNVKVIYEDKQRNKLAEKDFPKPLKYGQVYNTNNDTYKPEVLEKDGTNYIFDSIKEGSAQERGIINAKETTVIYIYKIDDRGKGVVAKYLIYETDEALKGEEIVAKDGGQLGATYTASEPKVGDELKNRYGYIYVYKGLRKNSASVTGKITKDKQEVIFDYIPKGKSAKGYYVVKDTNIELKSYYLLTYQAGGEASAEQVFSDEKHPDITKDGITYKYVGMREGKIDLDKGTYFEYVPQPKEEVIKATTTYVANSDLEYGQQKPIITQQDGKRTTNYKIENDKVVPVVTEEKATDGRIEVGNVKKAEESIPIQEETQYDVTKDFDYKEVKEGTIGKKVTTETYSVDSKTGALSAQPISTSVNETPMIKKITILGVREPKVSTQNVTRTIRYIDKVTGEEIHDAVVQSGERTKTDIINHYTNDVLKKGTWSTVTFDEVISPSVKNYGEPYLEKVEKEEATYDSKTIYVRYPQEIEEKIETHKATRTIHYIDAVTKAEIAPDKVQEVTVSRTNKRNKVTDKVEYGTWSTAKWDAVDSPNIANYTEPSLATVAQAEVTSSTKDSEITVEYKQETEEVLENKTITRTIRYVDVTAKTEIYPTITQTATISRTNIRNKVTGAVTEGTWSEGIWNEENSPIWSIYDGPNIKKVEKATVTDKTKDVEVVVEYTQGLQEVLETHEATRTIHYLDGERGYKIADEKVQKVEISRKNIRNRVTNKVTEGKWSTAKWDAVDSPKVENYDTPDVKTVEAVVISPETKDISVDVFYPRGIEEKTETHKATRIIHYVDATTGAKIAPDKVQEVTVSRTKKRNKITNEVKYGTWSTGEWAAVDSPKIENYDVPEIKTIDKKSVDQNTKNEEITIKYKQALDIRAEEKKVTRRIHYVKAKTKEERVVSQDVTFRKVTTYNKVTKETTVGNWEVPTWSNKNFPKSPVVLGTEAEFFFSMAEPLEDIPVVEPSDLFEKTIEGKNAGYLKQEDVHIDDKDKDVYIYYSSVEKEPTKIEYETKYVADETLRYGERKTIQKGYDGSGQKVTTYAYNPATKQIETTVTTETTSNAQDEIIHVGTTKTKTIERIVNFFDMTIENSLKDPVIQEVIFKNVGTVDEKTGVITEGTWSTAKLSAIEVPQEIKGYERAIDILIEGTDQNSLKITAGKWSLATLNDVEIPESIKGVRDLVQTPSEAASVGEITLTANAETIISAILYTPKIEKTAEKKTITRTIHYLDETTNKKVFPDKVQSVTLTHTKTKNKVTGEEKDLGWTEGVFEKVLSPSDDRYFAPNPGSVAEEKVTKDSENKEETVYYTQYVETVPNYEWIGRTIHWIDAETGKEIYSHGQRVQLHREDKFNRVTEEKEIGSWSTGKWNSFKTETAQTQPSILAGYDAPNISEIPEVIVTHELKDKDNDVHVYYGKTYVKDEELPYDIVYVADTTLPYGQQKVVVDGVEGSSRKVTKYGYNNDTKKTDKIESTDIKSAVTKVIHVGTKQTKKVERIVSFIDIATGEELEKAVEQKVELEKNDDVNPKTGVLTAGEWTVKKLSAVAVPQEIKGYERAITGMSPNTGEITIDGNSEDIDIIIPYTQGIENIPEEKIVTRIIQYLDATTKEKVSEPVTQTATINRTNVRNKVTGVVTNGEWSTAELSAVDSPLVANYNAPDRTKVDEVAITENTTDATETVLYTQGTETLPEEKIVTRTIQYLDATTKEKVAEPVTQTATINRTNVRNKVTGVVTKGTWSTSELSAIESPIVANYNAPTISKVESAQVTEQSENNSIIVYYGKTITTSKELPYPRVYKEDKTKEVGYREVTTVGVPTVETTTITYIPTSTGEVTKKETTTKNTGVTEVITIGTKPKVEEREIPYKTIYKEDPKLEAGQKIVEQEGKVGKEKTTTTYKLDLGTGEVTSNTTTEKIEKVDEIIRIGIGEKVETYKYSYEFVSGTSGKTLPKEVLDLLPKEGEYTSLVALIPELPERLVVEMQEGEWFFVDYSPEEVDVFSDVVFTGRWIYKEKAIVPPKPVEPIETPKPVEPPKSIEPIETPKPVEPPKSIEPTEIPKPVEPPKSIEPTEIPKPVEPPKSIELKQSETSKNEMEKVGKQLPKTKATSETGSLSYSAMALLGMLILRRKNRKN